MKPCKRVIGSSAFGTYALIDIIVDYYNCGIFDLRDKEFENKRI